MYLHMQQTPKPDAQLPWAIPPRSSHSPLKETTQDFFYHITEPQNFSYN